MDAHPLIERLVRETGARTVHATDVQAWEDEPGDAVLLFAGDPVRFPEALDVAVVLPELRRVFGGAWRVGIAPRADEDALARRYAVQRWPSLVFLRDGGYLGTVSGMKDWDEYLRDVGATLAATPGRRPAPVITIHGTPAACA